LDLRAISTLLADDDLVVRAFWTAEFWLGTLFEFVPK
jgi:hypothetical protein